jgi:hypothetical protein
MATCSVCGCDLPGVETLCRDCYYQEYWRVNAPRRNFWQWLGQNGWKAFVIAGMLGIAVAVYYALVRVPRLLHGIQFLYLACLWCLGWVLTPWTLVKEWKERRTLRTLFVGVIFAMQIICIIFWWTKGTQLWLQINTAIFVVTVFYSLIARAFESLENL